MPPTTGDGEGVCDHGDLGSGRMTIRCAFVSATIICVLLLAPVRSVGSPKSALTVQDSIETARFMYPYGADPVFISPDKKTYLVLLERGDISRNGCWVELLAGSTASLNAARNPHIVARLFSKSTAQANDLISNVQWLEDSEHVSFLWDDGRQPRQVVGVDVRNGDLQVWARHATSIVEYDISRDGRTIVFTAERRHDALQERLLEQNGFAVTNQSVWSILEGDFDGWTREQHYDTFSLSRQTGSVSRIREPQTTWSTRPELLRLSPDGRYAIAVRPVSSVPDEWNSYSDHIFKDDYLPAARRNPDGPNLIRQYYIIDIKAGIARPLWNAPENPTGEVVWSPDSNTVVIGPTFIPVPSANPIGLAGDAVAEVDVVSGRYVVLPLPQQLAASQYIPTRWSEDGVLELSEGTQATTGSGQLTFKKSQGEWTMVDQASGDKPKAAGVEIEVREDLNTPPALYVRDSTMGTEKLITDPNPQLADRTLGHVELVHWKASDGRPWTGVLYYPVHFLAGRQFPLVIQTHGYSEHQFSLDGSFTTVFAAQELANQDIAVLQVGGPDGGAPDADVTPREPEVYMAGYEGAIDHFVGTGLTNVEKIGIIGFSRTGWSVEYMLTHSRYPLAAAEVADNIDCSYFQYVLSSNAVKSEFEADNGASPLVDGLQAWAGLAAGFNVDKIRTPLRMEIDTGPVDSILRDWEIFSNLRYLQRPVELFIIPDIQHGVHILQNPAQRLASQGGSVDWFCFWLKDQIDPDPAKTAEYSRWRSLEARLKR